MTRTDSAELAASEVAAIQRRTIRVLIAAQIFSAAGITVGALLAQDMLGSTGLAGVPGALFTIGSAAAAAAVGQLSQRWGRRFGLATGYSVGAIGSIGVVVAGVIAIACRCRSPRCSSPAPAPPPTCRPVTRR